MNMYELDRRDVEFLAMVSREMRPSLHSIVGTARRLSEAPLGVENQNRVHAILASAEMILSVVDNILDCPMIKKLTACVGDEGNLPFPPPSGNQMPTSTVLALRAAPLPSCRGEVAKLPRERLDGGIGLG